MYEWTSQQSPASTRPGMARLMAALRQAETEHRIEPEDVAELWDWIVEGNALHARSSNS